MPKAVILSGPLQSIVFTEMHGATARELLRQSPEKTSIQSLEMESLCVLTEPTVILCGARR